MTEDAQGRQRKRWRLWLALATLGAILAALIVPPFLSVSRYKSRITQLMSASLGRPVRLSSVELRLLPRPGFVLTDLTVEEDPAYGAEPVLHANTVSASIRLLSLWRGRLEISRVSVDEASLNLVRTTSGQWNVDYLFRTAAAQAQSASGSPGPRRGVALPYLEATNSRINIKNGAEKLPFSLLDADLSFWQEEPGDWRIRLRGQPARTDVSLDLADTGIVRLEASLRRASQLRQIPVRLDLEWREAQLGQLARLVIGSDPGWRGDLTGELHLEGTADAAQIKTRLRAANVHRAEFAPAAPLDFDANCGFLYRFSGRALENLVCDSPLGDGRIRFSGGLPGEDRTPHFSVELDRIPVAAALDALRTVRSGFGPGLEARGTVSGKITYAENVPEMPPAPARVHNIRLKQPRPAAHGPLAGNFTVEGLELRGDGLREPIRFAKLVLEPAPAAPGRESVQFQQLAATAPIPAGAAVPLTVAVRLALSGYQVTVRGQASFARARELAHVAGVADWASLDALAGEAIALDLSAEGPWLVPERDVFDAAENIPHPAPDQLTGTLTIHDANWKADYLANPVDIAQATLHFGNGETRWDPIAFSYGPVKGTASLSLPSACESPQPCPPRFQVEFGALDATALEAAILGAREPGTLFSTFIASLSPTPAPAWPSLEGAAAADSLVLGPVTLEKPSATLRVLPNGAEITGLDAGVLGGRVHGTGTLRAAGTPGADGKASDKPAYTLGGQFENLSPAAVGQLLGLRWSGGGLDGNGKIDLSGFTGKDLAASAKGDLHFEWRHGSVGPIELTTPAAVAAGPPAEAPAAQVPASLARFDRWTANAEVADGAITLKENQVRRGARQSTVSATLTFGDPPKVDFTTPKEIRAAKQ